MEFVDRADAKPSHYLLDERRAIIDVSVATNVDELRCKQTLEGCAILFLCGFPHVAPKGTNLLGQRGGARAGRLGRPSMCADSEQKWLRQIDGLRRAA